MIEEKEIPYEILIRLSGSGVAGAHFMTLRQIIKDGQVVAESENPPQDVAENLADILGVALTHALIEIDNLKAQLNNAINPPTQSE